MRPMRRLELAMKPGRHEPLVWSVQMAALSQWASPTSATLMAWSRKTGSSPHDVLNCIYQANVDFQILQLQDAVKKLTEKTEKLAYQCQAWELENRKLRHTANVLVAHVKALRQAVVYQKNLIAEITRQHPRPLGPGRRELANSPHNVIINCPDVRISRLAM